MIIETSELGAIDFDLSGDSKDFFFLQKLEKDKLKSHHHT